MIAAKLNRIMAELRMMAKEGQMSGPARYAYLTEEQVVRELHDLFVKHGLVIVPSKWEVLREFDCQTSSGAAMHYVRVLATYSVLDTEDDSSLEIQAIGEGADLGDKACNKAMTGAYKYALRQSLMIATGDDPDAMPSMPGGTAEPVASYTLRERGNSKRPLSEAQRRLINTLAHEAFGDDKRGFAELMAEIAPGVKLVSRLNSAQASQLIDRLRRGGQSATGCNDVGSSCEGVQSDALTHLFEGGDQ